MKIIGKYTVKLPVETFGKNNEYKKIKFIVKTDQKFNNLHCFEIFGEEKIAAFESSTKLGDDLDVEFNIQCREWKDKNNETQWTTTLGAWKVNKLQSTAEIVKEADENDDLPF